MMTRVGAVRLCLALPLVGAAGLVFAPTRPQSSAVPSSILLDGEEPPVCRQPTLTAHVSKVLHTTLEWLLPITTLVTPKEPRRYEVVLGPPWPKSTELKRFRGHDGLPEITIAEAHAGTDRSLYARRVDKAPGRQGSISLRRPLGAHGKRTWVWADLDALDLA